MHKRIFVCICAMLVVVTSIWAQNTVGSTLTGKVTNSKGAAVPNATVTLTNANTKNSVKVLSGPDGMFTLAPVPPGTYSMEVESAGYKRAVQDNIVLATTAPATVNVTLIAGNPKDVVKLTATAPAIQTDNGEIHMTLNEAQL